MGQSVENLLTKHSVEYKPMGSRFLVRCFNPDHEDNNPSLSIDSVTGLGKCFACGYKVNIFKYYNAPYNFDTLKLHILKQRLQEVTSSTTGLELPSGYIPWTRDYRGISEVTLRKYEAFKVSNSDLENRIVFPLRDITGKIKVFIGRHLYSDEKDKYKIWPRKITPPMFPAIVKPRQGSVIIVEGIIDTLNLHDKGMTNVVTLFGVTPNREWLLEQLKLLRIQGITKIYLMFDGDKAGQNGTETILPILEEYGFEADNIELPEGVDPGDLTAAEVSALGKLIWK